MHWDDRYDRQWEEGYRHAAEYFKEYGNLDVPTMFRSQDGYALGCWVVRQRGEIQKLDGERIARLEEIGMVWEKEESWAMRYRLAERYYREHGDLKIPGKCVMDGVWMDKWISEQRKRYKDGKLTREQIQALDRLDMDWDGKLERDWNTRYQAAKAYYDAHGDLRLPHNTQKYRELENWLDRQKRKYDDGKQSEAHIEKLRQIGFDPETYKPRARRSWRSTAPKSTGAVL